MYLQRYRDWVRDLAQVFEEDSGKSSSLGKSELNVPIHSKDSDATLSSENVDGSPSHILALLHQQTKRNRVLVLIFDQFEEFFFEFEQLAIRSQFYNFLQDCLAMPYVKVILSLREDYIHYLLGCGRLTTLDIIDNNILDKKWLYYLGNFSFNEAKAVINDLTAPTPYSPEPA